MAAILPLSLTVGLTAGGIAMAAAEMEDLGLTTLGLGLIVAPSVGHMYTGDWWRVLGFSLGRALCGGALMWAAFDSAMSAAFEGDSGSGNLALGTLAMAGLISLTILDIAIAPAAARRFNEEVAARHLTIAPMIVPPPAGNSTDSAFVGLSFQGTF